MCERPILIRVLVAGCEIARVEAAPEDADRVAGEQARLATVYGGVRLVATCDDWPAPVAHDVTYDPRGALVICEVSLDASGDKRLDGSGAGSTSA